MKSIRTIILAILLFAVYINAHGYLTFPRTRYTNPTYLNSPAVVAPNKQKITDPAIVCRNTQKKSNLASWYPGQIVEITYKNTAHHIGDCYMYISYDSDEVTDFDKQWMKVGQMRDCLSGYSGDRKLQFKLPDWILPCDSCVFRFEWFAYHTFPNVEYFVDCADVSIGGSNTVDPQVTMLTVPGYLEGQSHPNPWAGTGHWFLSPEVATSPIFPNAHLSFVQTSGVQPQADDSPTPDIQVPDIPTSSGTCMANENSAQLKCYPGNCCPEYYQCVHGNPTPFRSTSPGTICYNGGQVHTWDSRCSAGCQNSGIGGNIDLERQDHLVTLPSFPPLALFVAGAAVFLLTTVAVVVILKRTGNTGDNAYSLYHE